MMIGRPDVSISVIIPCFNHGHFLEECLASVAAQEFAPNEVIVIDDGSTDPFTLEILSRLEHRTGTVVLHQPNLGPSAARNRGIDATSGTHVLFVDADNRLRPTATRALMAARLAAGPSVRWVYQHQEMFGSRNETVVHPAFNLALLLEANYCDTCALVDRTVFDAGFRFREDIGLGHEDWDFFLSLAAAGYTGTACPGVHLDMRKQGFSRSDLVDWQTRGYQRAIRRLQPDLYRPCGRAEVKRAWAPALSVVALGNTTVDEVAMIRAGLDVQTCTDTELVEPTVRCSWLDDLTGVREAVARARGRWAYLTPAENLGALTSTTFVEKALRLAAQLPPAQAIALARRGPADAGPDFAPAAGGLVDCAGLIASVELLEFLQDDDWDDVTSLVSAISSLALGGVLPRWVDRGLATVAPVDLGAPISWSVRARSGYRWLPEGPPLRGGSTPEDTIADSSALERWYRQRIAAPLFVRPDVAGIAPWHDDVSKHPSAPDHWVPPASVPVSTGVDPATRSLRLVRGEGDRSLARVIGHLLVHQPPGAIAVWERADPLTLEHETGFGLHAPPGARVLGYASSACLPDMVDLEAAANEIAAAAWDEGGRFGPAPVLRLAAGTHKAYIDPPLTIATKPLAASARPDARPLWWRLHEGPDPDDPLGGPCYALHPDHLARQDSWRPIAMVRDPSGGRSLLLVDLHQSETSRRCPSVHLDEAVDHGYRPAQVLGGLDPLRARGLAPLFRFHSLTGGNHRISLDPGAPPGYAIDGPLACARPAPADRGVLFRWRHRSRTMWRYSFDGPLLDRSDEFVLDGTLGMAAAPSVVDAGLVDVVEVYDRDGDSWSVVLGDEGTPTHAIRRPVARLLRIATDAGFPLFTVGGAAGRVLSANPEELTAGMPGWAIEGIAGGLEPAVPPDWIPPALDERPAVRSGDLVPALAPFSTPAYRMVNTDGAGSVTLDLQSALAAGHRVERIVGYLPGAGVGDRTPASQQSTDRPVRPRARWRASAGAALGRRRPT